MVLFKCCLKEIKTNPQSLQKTNELDKEEFIIENLESATEYDVEVIIGSDEFGNSSGVSETVRTIPKTLTGKEAMPRNKGNPGCGILRQGTQH